MSTTTNTTPGHRRERVEIAGLIHGVQDFRYRVRLRHDGALRDL